MPGWRTYEKMMAEPSPARAILAIAKARIEYGGGPGGGFPASIIAAMEGLPT